MYNDWRDQHYIVMTNFISSLNRITDKFILKGGTSLMLCYGLDRFSEDIDLDAIGNKVDMQSIIERFCICNNISYRVAKNTDTVKRYMIHYGGAKPLKVEISYRRNKCINIDEFTIINNIVVYTIQNMAVFKLNAYLGRDKIRDLYDIIFIYRNYVNILSSSVIMQLQYAIAQKGLEYFDYIIKTQQDNLIDKDKLASDFLDVYCDLGFM